MTGSDVGLLQLCVVTCCCYFPDTSVKINSWSFTNIIMAASFQSHDCCVVKQRSVNRKPSKPLTRLRLLSFHLKNESHIGALCCLNVWKLLYVFAPLMFFFHPAAEALSPSAASQSIRRSSEGRDDSFTVFISLLHPANIKILLEKLAPTKHPLLFNTEASSYSLKSDFASGFSGDKLHINKEVFCFLRWQMWHHKERDC